MTLAGALTFGLPLAGAGVAAAAPGDTQVQLPVELPVQISNSAGGAAINASGVISGNEIQVPVHVSISACGNMINAVLLNPAFGATRAHG
jgi:hypothetical protein